jgi:hypothetical protein
LSGVFVGPQGGTCEQAGGSGIFQMFQHFKALVQNKRYNQLAMYTYFQAVYTKYNCLRVCRNPRIPGGITWSRQLPWIWFHRRSERQHAWTTRFIPSLKKVTTGARLSLLCVGWRWQVWTRTGTWQSE